MNANTRKTQWGNAGLMAALFVLLASGLAIPQPHQAKNDTVTIRYEPDEADFPNPERGFHKNTELLTARDLHWVREQGYSLVRAYVRLDDFRDKPLSPQFLRQLTAGFVTVRAAGIKVLPIFAYNFPTDDDIKTGRVKNSPDAPLPLVLQHLRQIKPILAQNQDVIAALELGIVGAWGEWHSSGNHLDTPENKQIILNAILDALPRSRMMQLRYPADVMTIYPIPLGAKQAHNGSHQARTGWANMCFLSNVSDSGTYQPLDTKAEKQKYLEQMTRYVVVGGETCQITPEQSRADCPTALAEFARFHFSYLNTDFYQPTIARWKQEGCLKPISRRLGYRFRLTESTIPRHARPGEALPLRLSLINDGWAAPYNPRRVELILRRKADGRLYRFPVHCDPRRWFAGTEETSVPVIANIPPDALQGDYEALLALPDPMPSLANRPEYAIRLANRDVWEAATGFNRLLADVYISGSF